MPSFGRRGSAALLFALLAALASPPATARAEQSPREPGGSGWTEYRTAHFTAIANASPRRTFDILRRLERFRQVLALVYARFQVEAPVDTVVAVFRDPAAMKPFAPRFEGRPVEIAGLFEAGPDANVMLVDGSTQGDPLPVIYHEYMHYFELLNFPPLPLWFNEGLAECYGTFRTDADTAEVGRVNESHVAYLRTSVLMPLVDLFAVRPGSSEYNEGDRRGVFYAESWAVTHYLLWDNPDRRPQLADFLDNLGAGQPPEAAFASAFDIDLPAFEAEFKRHIAQNRFHHTIARFKDQDFDKEVRTRALPPEEALTRLSEIMVFLDPERAAQAESMLAPAMAATPPPAGAWRTLARAQAAQGRRSEALSTYERALEADPKDARALFLYGQALLEQGDAASAARGTDALRRSVTERPQFLEAALAFSQALLRQPDTASRADLDRAIGLLEDGLKRMPHRGDAAVTLTFLYATRGDLDRAEAFVRSVLPRMTEAATVDSTRDFVQSRRLLAEARRPPGTGTPETPSANDPPPLPPVADPPPPRAPEGRAGAPGRPPTPPPDQAEVARLLSIPAGEIRDGDCISVFNEAAALGNARRYKDAIALIDRFLPACTFPEIRPQLVDLGARLRRDAARPGVPVR
jgi:tetratricopeptide (TPR) repeat protein